MAQLLLWEPAGWQKKNPCLSLKRRRNRAARAVRDTASFDLFFLLLVQFSALLKQNKYTRKKPAVVGCAGVGPLWRNHVFYLDRHERAGDFSGEMLQREQDKGIS